MSKLPRLAQPAAYRLRNEQQTRRGVVETMWRRPRKPMTDEQRAHQIRRLEGARDRLLADAPRHLYFRRFLLPPMLVLVVLAVGKGLWEHPSQITLGHGVFVAVPLLSTRKVWRTASHSSDKCAASDALAYEGDSPRDIHKKIDALRDGAQ